ncbi:signal element on autosome protein 2 [Stomoxys calcitrans]|uniref:signal element on autosome protein 2 n=1 Tax=Stomoxys calcitrans TaxID=35570 RepID=UPI0027E381F5|nr:signal element on autosome protein 2 [Stomoxys calcitrans]
MNDYWHIPRASLSPSSASSAVSSASSTQRSHRTHTNTSKLTPTHYRHQTSPTAAAAAASASSLSHHHHRPQHHRQQGGGRSTSSSTSSSKRDSGMNSSPHYQPHANALMVANNKRGSRSSQGSNDSNNSTRSAASGSLLLTAANLERMTEIHRKQEKHQNRQQYHNQLQPTAAPTTTTIPPSVYSANLIHAATRGARDYQLATVEYNEWNGARRATPLAGDHVDHAAASMGGNHTTTNNNNSNAVIDIDPNLNFIKTKDLDTVSIASSMHFTMVNGEAGANKKTKKGLCDRGRQVTVLIISMSTIFLLLIMGMVYALEMRAREMPQS